MEQLKLFKKNLPRKPYCSDDLESGLRIRNAANAALYRYIQPNNPNSKLWLLFDIDRATGPEELTDELLLPSPTLWVQNRKNGHAHALYALENAVHFNSNSSQSAIRYAAAIDVALSQKMNADAGYSGLICKNPLNDYWRTYATGGQYDLHDLSEFVDLNKYKDKRKNLPEIGLGRNCTVFNNLRLWSYKAIRQGWPDYDRWLMACEARASMYNNFKPGLDVSEIKQIAKSVAKWTYNHFSRDGFNGYIDRLKAFTHSSEQQSIKGKKSAQNRRSKREVQILEAIQNLQDNGQKVTKIAVSNLVGINERNIRKNYSHLFEKKKPDLNLISKNRILT